MHLRLIKNATLAHALFGRYGKKRQERRVYGNRGGGRKERRTEKRSVS